MALVVQREQCFLHEVFHVIRERSETPAEERAQMRGRLAQKRAVGRLVAVERRDEERAQT